MNAPFNLFSGLTDMNGKSIMVGDIIRKYDYVLLGGIGSNEYLEGRVVFAYGSYRMCIEKNYNGSSYPVESKQLSLTQHYTLLYDQILGTKNIEVIIDSSIEI